MTAPHLVNVVSQIIVRGQLAASRLVVGVSGGPDSVALLLALADLRERYQLDLYIAHYDHALRPDSAADADWVAQLARELGIDLTIERARSNSTKAIPSRKSEAASRQRRYQFFGNVLARVGAGAVLVGHTRNDQLETRIMHIVRGTGFRGLRGMSIDSLVRLGEDTPVRVIRPLLGVSRAQIEAFCAAHEVEPRRDPTNASLVYARNRIRLSVVPELITLNPRLADALDRLAGIAEDGEAFIESELDRRLNELVRVNAERWTIDRSRWRELHPALKRALLRRAAESVSPEDEVDGDSIEAAIVAADRWTAGRTLTWPGDRVVIVEHDYFQLARSLAVSRSTLPIPLSWNEPLTVELGERTSWDGTGDSNDRGQRGWTPTLRTCPRAGPCPGRSQDRWHADLDRDKVSGNKLIVRSRQSGDWFCPEGMIGRKKLQDLFVDAHLPERLRDQVPIVASSAGIAWVVGLRRDGRFVAGPESTEVLCLSVGT